jgi:hypothetical protein
VLPDIHSTRLARSADFFSVCYLLNELDNEGCIFSDRRRNAEAMRLVTWLSDGVDAVRQKARRAEGVGSKQALFRDYLLTIQGDTDSQSTRLRRHAILKDLLGGIFERRDSLRLFTAEQRRLIWNSDDKRRCKGCGDQLTWANFTLDHVKAHSRGGKTAISNAALMCRSCNSRKGGRRAA